MFIAHGDKVRKHARWIMFGVLILLIPGFVMLFTTTGNTNRRGGDLPTVRGKPVNAADFEQMRELVRAQYVVMQGRDLSRTPQMQDQIKQETVVQILMLRKGQEMGVTVSEEEWRVGLLSQPIFLNSAGQFDRENFAKFMILLNNNGVSQSQFEEVMRQRLLIEKLQRLVTAAAKATPLEVQQAYLPLHEKLTVDVVRFDIADYKESVVVSNEEVRAFFEENKESFRVPAKVKIHYAEFKIADARKNIVVTEDEIADFYNRTKFRYETNGVSQALDSVKLAVQNDLLDNRANQAAADRAQEFSLRLSQTPKPAFDKLAADFGVTPVTTDFISAFDVVPGVVGIADFAARANHLSPEMPVSDPLGGSNSYYVLEYVTGQPSLIPPFEQVQAEVTEQVKRLRTYINTLRRAQENIAKLKELVAGGQTFAQACTQLKLKVETPPPFTVSDEKPDLPAAGRIQQSSLELPVHGVSGMIETAFGAVVFHLRDRQPPDPAAFEKDRERITRQVLQRNRQAMFNDWIQALLRTEQVDFKLPPRQQDDAASAAELLN